MVAPPGLNETLMHVGIKSNRGNHKNRRKIADAQFQPKLNAGCFLNFEVICKYTVPTLSLVCSLQVALNQVSGIGCGYDCLDSSHFTLQPGD